MDLSFYKGKKVLVTGHTGFKGSWLCRILVKAGAEVTGYSLEAPTDPNLFSMADVENNINSVIGDIRDLAHLKEVFKEVQPEIVLHLAAQPIVRDSYKDPVYTYETNVMGTVNICECGLRTTISSFLIAALTQSGTILSLAKSPPPITLPALAVDTDTSISLKNELI